VITIAQTDFKQAQGKHNRELDGASMCVSWKRVKDGLRLCWLLVGEKLPSELLEHEFSVSVPATYEIIVECKDERDQSRFLIN
jgi:hypothetical protein